MQSVKVHGTCSVTQAVLPCLEYAHLESAPGLYTEIENDSRSTEYVSRPIRLWLWRFGFPWSVQKRRRLKILPSPGEGAVGHRLSV